MAACHVVLIAHSYMHFDFKTEEAYGVQTKAVAVDLGQGREATDKVWNEIKGLDIGILGNLFKCTLYTIYNTERVFIFSEQCCDVRRTAQLFRQLES
jgi:hypothetical protein